MLVECGTVQQRLRKLPARVIVYLLLAAALFETAAIARYGASSPAPWWGCPW
nr:transposase domain-containing protein [Streptomyces sp. HSG2]